MQPSLFPAEREKPIGTLGRLFIAIILGIILSFFLSSLARSQTEIKIVGQVIDAISGAPIPGAAVHIEGLGKTVATDGTGHFRFTDLPVGYYSIDAQRIGYKLISPIRTYVSPSSASQIIVKMSPVPVAVSDQLVRAGKIDRVTIRREGNLSIVEIPRGGLENINDLVDRIPELELVESGAQEFLRIRGADLNGTVVMLDGRLINSTLTSRGDISVIPIGSVTRIEIARGGNYSTPGLAGSVNFRTDDRGHDRRIAVSGERGNHGFESYSFRTGGHSLAGLNPTLEWNNSFYRGDFSFIDPRDSIQTRQNNFSRTSKIFSTIDYDWKRAALKLGGRYFKRKAGVPGPIFQLTPEANSNIEEKEIYTRFSQGFGSDTELDLTAGVTNRHAEYDSPRTPTNFIPYKTVFDEQSRDIKIQIQRAGRIDLDSYLGIRYESLDGEDLIRPAAGFGFHSRLVNALGIAASYRFEKLSILNESSAIIIGLRKEGGDHGDFWAPSVTSRINLDLPAEPGFDFSYSRARRLPDLTDLYWKEDVFATPNADLQPEESRGYEIGFDLRNGIFGPVNLRISRYLTHYDNLIIWRKWAGDKFKPVNLSRAEISGWDVSLEANPLNGPVSLYWIASFTKPLNKESEMSHHDKFLTFRPIGTQNAAIEIDFENLKLRVAGRHIGRRYTTEENTKSLTPVDLIDLGINYKLQLRSIEAAFGIELTNVGDIQYEILDRQPQRPREYRARIEIRKIGGYK